MRRGSKTTRVTFYVDSMVYAKLEQIGKDYGFSEHDLLRQGARLVLDDYGHGSRPAVNEQLSAT